MNLKKYYNSLIKKTKDREDLSVEKFQLAYGRKNFPLFRIKSKYIGPKDKVFLITAGIHGDEISGPITILKRLCDIVDYAHRRDVKLIIYPLLNPSGFQAGTRYNSDNETMNNDFVRYVMSDGGLKDDLTEGEEFSKWHWSSALKLGLKLPKETALLHRLLKKEPLKNVVAFLDLHQDNVTQNLEPCAYHYSFGDLLRYGKIIEKIKSIVPLAIEKPIDAGQTSIMNTDKDGFIVRHDGTLCDLFFRLGAKYSVTAETVGKISLSQSVKVNIAWLYGMIDLIKKDYPDNGDDISARAIILPKRIDADSKVHLVHTSSPVENEQEKKLLVNIAKFQALYPRLKIFDVQKTELDPRHLSASEKERLTKFRRALKKVDWLQPVYGGTGAVDIARHFNEKDLKFVKKSRPVINGFSDTTTIVNYFYFKLKLLTFHYSNFQGLLENSNGKDFFSLAKGEKDDLEYFNSEYRWLGEKPRDNIKGVAIGGNLSTFRDMLEICQIRPRSWKPYILFVEDVELDVEDLHRVIIALDRRGIFQGVRAIVLGSIDEAAVSRDYRRFNFMFGNGRKADNPDSVFSYLLSGEIKKRREAGDPLHILKVNNLGHGVKNDNMIIPIGAKTLIQKNGKIEFNGPFVR